MPTLTVTLPADRLMAFCDDAAKRVTDRISEVMDDVAQDELLKGNAKEVHAAFLAAAGLDWK